MKRIRTLDTIQKIILTVMLVSLLVFAVLYPMTLHRVGFAYQDVIFTPKAENGRTVYSARLHGKAAAFTVLENQSVYFQYGEKTYGPYTAVEDATAIPSDHRMAEHMTGVELRLADEVLFRGGILQSEGNDILYEENGASGLIHLSYTTADGIKHDEAGNEIDPVAPTASVILQLMRGPELTHKGVWWGWFAAFAICAINACSILFADELFRWNLSFQVRNVSDAEPAEPELMARYIRWIVLCVVAVVFLICGLQ